MRAVLIFTIALRIPCASQKGILLTPILPHGNALEMLPVRAGDAKCMKSVLKICQSKFNSRLGITNTSDWTNYEQLISELNKILDTGADAGLLKVCRARSQFFQCLGEAYDSCINWFYFLTNGYTQESAWSYVEIFKELEFMCNGGILQSLRSWDCIRRYKIESDETYSACYDAFVNATEYYPTGLCEAGEAMMLCARLPYYSHCGTDVAWWECERVRLTLDIDSYCSHLSCNYELFPATRTLKQSRRQMFQSTNPHFMSPEKMNLYAYLGAKSEERAMRKKRALQG